MNVLYAHTIAKLGFFPFSFCQNDNNPDLSVLGLGACFSRLTSDLAYRPTCVQMVLSFIIHMDCNVPKFSVNLINEIFLFGPFTIYIGTLCSMSRGRSLERSRTRSGYNCFSILTKVRPFQDELISTTLFITKRFVLIFIVYAVNELIDKSNW